MSKSHCYAALAAIAIGCCVTPQTAADGQTEGKQKIIGYLTASFIKDDLSIAILRQDPPYRQHPGGGTPQLSIIKPGPARDLRTIYQLIGLVKIDSPAKALEFVRLRTAPSIALNGDCLPVGEHEVVSERELPSMPGFNHPGYDVSNWPGTHEHPPSWGFFGVLSNVGFAQGGFTEPTVEFWPGNGPKGVYAITRWTCRPNLPHPSFVVQKIRELVTPDGEYERIELSSQPAPKLRDTEWRLTLDL